MLFELISYKPYSDVIRDPTMFQVQPMIEPDGLKLTNQWPGFILLRTNTQVPHTHNYAIN